MPVRKKTVKKTWSYNTCFADGAVLEHGVHSERESDQDDTVDRQEVDEVAEKHLLDHDGETARDSAATCEEQKKDPAEKQRQRQPLVLVTVPTCVQHEPVDREDRKADADYPVRPVTCRYILV